MLYQSLSVILTQFNHANIRLPKKIDKLLSYLIVSPDMHKIHHHYRLPYTDANYGNIFSVWDRLFGTYMYLDREKIIYGVDVFPDEQKNSNIKELLNAMKEFDNLESFLEHVSLATSIDQDWEGEKINMMTMHAAKG